MKLMITPLLYLVALITSFNSIAAQAADEKILFDGVDITAFVDYYRPAVKTLDKSVTVFNWSKGASDSIWAEDFDPQNPKVTTNVRERSRSFWKNFGDKQGFMNAYGYGLYAAVDPVLTYSYGGGSTDWVLLQMELLVGFKMIYISEYFINKSTPDSKEKMQYVADQFQCPRNVWVSSLFESGGLYLNSRCRKLVQKVFNEILEIDGLTYTYSRTQFKACQAEGVRSMTAFVITSQNWIRSENLKFFTAKTVSDREDRIRIQTLFLTGNNPQNQLIFDYSKMMTELANNPESSVRRSKIDCKASICEISAEICNSQNSCKNMVLDPFPLSTGVTMTSFWRNFGNKNSVMGGMYGFGLYAATDPVLTNSYGGGGSGWVLLQIELPIGFKLIDVTKNDVSTDPNVMSKTQVISTKFKCPESRHIDDFFVLGGSDLDPLCKALTQKVFLDILEIDGFGYGYATKTFRACKKNISGEEDRAFVFTNPNSIHMEDIRYYTSKTLSDRENRIRIQTLFFEAAEVAGAWLGESLPGSIMTRLEASLTVARELLWPDMDGVKMSPTINSWLLQNKYACDGKLPY